MVLVIEDDTLVADETEGDTGKEGMGDVPTIVDEDSNKLEDQADEVGINKATKSPATRVAERINSLEDRAPRSWRIASLVTVPFLSTSANHARYGDYRRTGGLKAS